MVRTRVVSLAAIPVLLLQCAPDGCGPTPIDVDCALGSSDDPNDDAPPSTWLSPAAQAQGLDPDSGDGVCPDD